MSGVLAELFKRMQCFTHKKKPRKPGPFGTGWLMSFVPSERNYASGTHLNKWPESWITQPALPALCRGRQKGKANRESEETDKSLS